MRNYIVLLMILGISSFMSFGQGFDFIEQDKIMVTENFFREIEKSEIGYADIDNDGDLDVYISGDGLYINDGNGKFTLDFSRGISEYGLNGSVGFADIDGDNDQDILITGSFYSNEAVLAFNDGSGHFTVVPNSNIVRVEASSIVFGDIDNDNDQDVIVTGYHENIGNRSTRVYRNDGNGVFENDVLQPFHMSTPNPYYPFSTYYGLQDGNADLADIDLDGDLDLIISGNTTKLFINDGTGVFILNTSVEFDQPTKSSVEFADMNGDNYPDILLTGDMTYDGMGYISKIYLNTTTGGFQELLNTIFHEVIKGATDFGDIDNDGDLDLILTGGSDNGPSSKIYKNNGVGIYTLVSDTILKETGDGDVAFFDFDNDNDLDLLISGNGRAHVYENDGAGNFSHLLTDVYGFTEVYYNTMKFADIDGDGDQDVCLVISSGTGTLLYENDGFGNFIELTGSNIQGGTSNGSVDFADVDGDYDLDLIISSSSTPPLLYFNDGNGNFTLSVTSTFTLGRNGVVVFADIDGDEDQDLLVTGTTATNNVASGAGYSAIYKNDGYGNFTSFIQNFIPEGVRKSDAVFADFDGDNDLDLLISGELTDWCYTFVTYLYLNDGNGNFSLKATPMDQLGYTSIDFADVDGDDDLDVILLGHTFTLLQPEGVNCKLYLNDGNANFVQSFSNNLYSGWRGNVAFSDLDGDNDPDLIISGGASVSNDTYNYTKLYENNGSGIFTEVFGHPFYGVNYSTIEFADVDGDNDQDVFITGRSNFSESGVYSLSRLFFNQNGQILSNSDSDLMISGVTIFPNPTSGEVNVSLGELNETGTMQLMDIKGSVLLTEMFSGNQTLSLDLKDQPSGVYILTIETNSSSSTHKIFKQ